MKKLVTLVLAAALIGSTVCASAEEFTGAEASNEVVAEQAEQSVNIDNDLTYFIPEGLGSSHTYTIWDRIRWGGDCRVLINKLNGRIGDSYGIVRYGDAFAGAMTSSFGNVGDVVLVVNYDGVVYPVCIADEKSQRYCAWDHNPANTFGHLNGKDIVEFEVLKSCVPSLYNGTGSYVSELMNRNIYKIINIGSIYDDDTIVNADVIRSKARAHGLGGYLMLTSPYDGYSI